MNGNSEQKHWEKSTFAKAKAGMVSKKKRQSPKRKVANAEIRFMRSILPVILACILLTSCFDHTYTPKPTGYPRIDLPEKHYKSYTADCPFSIRIPTYANISKDSSRDAEPCWYNLNFPTLNAKIHLSYKPVTSSKNFYQMADDAHTFAYKHTVKAEDIEDSIFRLPNGVNGVLFDIEGNTASSIQFFATDTVKHYLRGSLYFNSRPNKDSLAPVIQFIRTDIDTLLRSLRWR